MTRRDALVLSAAVLAATKFPRAAFAQQAESQGARHGMSAFGDLKHPADFTHLPYVNPQAPKGGAYSEIISRRGFNGSFLTFNSLNGYILKGEGAFGLDMIFATLMARANDEPDAMYGLAARAVAISADGLTYTFTMRPEATFHDGSKLTAHDVAWSLTTLKDKGHPIVTQSLRDFKTAEAPDDATVIVRFVEKRARDVPLFVAGLPIFSRAYYGKQPFDQSTMEPPLGSGPYKVGKAEPGRFIEYVRVKDWWGADLPVSRGQYNFDTVRYEYFRDRDVGFEAFTAKAYLLREEFTSRVWATRYDFPALREGKVKRDVLADDTPSGAQGWFINTRRDKFKNRDLREALDDAFDFEWTNKTIMYGSYERTHSVFQNSTLMAEGEPGPDERALLEPFRATVPEAAFGPAYLPPVSDGSGQDRRLLRRASQLLTEAGFPIKNGRRLTPQGAPLSLEFLLDEPTFQPHHMPYIKNLATLGIDARLRMVDPVQMQQRLKEFDFDLTVQRFGFSATPGDALRSFFSSQSAATPGSRNLSGIADPAIDAMIDRVLAATSREELTTACRALDRLIRARHIWIPHWYKPSHWIAYWDRFERPPVKPRYARGIPETWWHKADPAAAPAPQTKPR